MRTLFDTIPTAERPAVTFTDLIDLEKLAAWIGEDLGNVPMRPAYTGHYYRHRDTEDKRTRTEKAADWLRNHVEGNEAAFYSSSYSWKPKTYKAFIGECLSAVGIKGGTVAERQKRAAAELRCDGVKLSLKTTTTEDR